MLDLVLVPVLVPVLDLAIEPVLDLAIDPEIDPGPVLAPAYNAGGRTAARATRAQEGRA